MASIFLKFLYQKTDGCLGSGKINLFDQNGNVIPYTKILNIPYDDFIKDNKTVKEIFSTTYTSANRLWSGVESAYFIAELDVTDITKITKIGINTWGNTSYPTEDITVYMSNLYDGEYKEIAHLLLNSKTQGTRTMIYADTNASIVFTSKTVQSLVANKILNNELIKQVIMGGIE